jgi:hypothetical protein
MEFLFFAVLICVVWTSAAIPLILGYLEKRGVDPRLIWPKLVVPDYVRQYQRVTQLHNGRTGALFYHSVIPLCVSILLVILMGILARI